VEAWKSGSEKGHGRIEQREYAVSENVDWLYERDEWKGIKTIVRNRSWREEKDAGSGEWQPATVFDRYYISSLDLSAEEMGKRIRNHWSIENNLHWMLDVDFGEDDDLKRTMHAPENMNILRKAALSCIKRAEPENKKSLKHYMRQALFYDEYRKHLLFDSK
jgi:predicted transposase YbfD/YdcC